MHTNFTLEEQNGLTAFGFRTTQDNTKVYFVPTSNSRRQIEMKTIDEPQYVFHLGPFITHEQLENIDWSETTQQ